MTFEEFFKKKKIDLAALESADPTLFSQFRSHFEHMGEKSFDHTKKYWFNKLRRQYPLPVEIKTEKVHIENPLAEQTITESLLEEGLKAAAPKPGFTPKLRAAAGHPKSAEEKVGPTGDNATPEETERLSAANLPKPGGFTPRFKAAAPPKKSDDVIEETSSESSESVKSPDSSLDQQTSPPQPYKPRFKPQVLQKRPEE